jgi:cell division protein FtsB
MTRTQGIFLSVTVVLLFSLLFFIIFGEHGFMDLNVLKSERDPKYIENIARQELGMVAEDELILKPQSLPKP